MLTSTVRSQTQAKCLPMNTGQESRGRKLLATAGGQTRKPCFSLAIPPDSVVQALGSPFTLGIFFGSPLSLKLYHDPEEGRRASGAVGTGPTAGHSGLLCSRLHGEQHMLVSLGTGNLPRSCRVQSPKGPGPCPVAVEELPNP